MSHATLPLSRRAWVAVLVALPLATVVFWWAVATGSDGGPLVLLAVAIPLLVFLLPLLYIAREVASHPDDPEEVEGRLAASLGLSKAEFEKRFEERAAGGAAAESAAADDPPTWEKEE